MEIVDVKLEQLIPLTAKEEALRAQFEEQIFTTVRQAYIEIGRVLTEINTRRLYKSTHFTFASYSAEVLDMAKSRAHQYIDAFGVVQNLQLLADDSSMENVHHGGQNEDGDNVRNCAQIPLPKNERQARALVNLDPEEQRQIWLQSIETAPEGKITASHIRKTIRLVKGNQVVDKAKKDKRDRKPNESRIGEGFQEAFNTFLGAVQIEINTNWKETDRLSVVRYLDAIRGTISENGNHRIPEHGYAIEASNTEKLLDAGFTILRADTIRLIIEKAVGHNNWVVVETFDDVDRLKAVFDESLKDLNTLRG